jgi:cytochrome c-type biogenesis protein CcmH/NrfG
VALTFIAIVLLAAAWAALLLPDLRGRGRPSRRSDSIATFNRQLSTIERARPGQRPSARVVAFPQRAGAPVPPASRHGSSVAPRSSLQARQRRQNVLLGLAAFALVTLAAGVMISPYFLALHLVADLALGGFVWVLVQHRNRADLARARRTPREGYDAAPMARRRASGS